MTKKAAPDLRKPLMAPGGTSKKDTGAYQKMPDLRKPLIALGGTSKQDTDAYQKMPDLRKPLIALGGTLGLVVLVVLLFSSTPATAISYLLAGPLMSSLALGNTLALAARLALAGLAASLAFSAGNFNLGGEGQALAGGLAGAAVALGLPNLPPFIAPLTAAAAGMLAGAALGAVSGFLRVRWQVDELISTFLISAAAAPAAHVLLSGPLKDSSSYLIAAPALGESYRLSAWLPPSRLGPVILWVIPAVLLIHFFLSRTLKGFEWRVCRANREFARYGGIRNGRIIFHSLLLSGALYALAGSAALLDSGQAVQGFTGGLGWNGLAVALMASSRPLRVPLLALAYAWLLQGSQAALLHTDFPYALGGLVQGMIFILVTLGRTSQ